MRRVFSPAVLLVVTQATVAVQRHTSGPPFPSGPSFPRDQSAIPGHQACTTPWLCEEPVPGHCLPVPPVTQLREKYKVALFQTRTDADVEMLREGVIDHPMLTLVQNPADADFVLWSVVGDSFQDGPPPPGVPADKILLIEWSDGALVVPYIQQDRYLAVFKRSFVVKSDGMLTGVATSCEKSNCFPFSFGMLNQYLEGLRVSTVGNRQVRPTSLICSLRPWTARRASLKEHALPGRSEVDLVRQISASRNRVIFWLNQDRDLPSDALISKMVAGGNAGLTSESQHSGIQDPKWKSSAGRLYRVAGAQRHVDTLQDNMIFERDMARDKSVRDSIGPNYKQILRTSFVAVTANPSQYEGDHRVWEHFASGNVVISDEMFSPQPYAPVPGVHFHVFNNTDVPGARESLLQKIHQTIKDTEGSREMACAGLQHAMRHHRSVSRVDYILRSAAEKKWGHKYKETGMQLREKDPVPTREQQDYVARARQMLPDYFFAH